jgi:hypothetical protein
MLFQAPAQIAKIQTMADPGNRVVIDTQELSPENMATLFSLKQGGLGFFLFKGSTITTEEIPDYDPVTFDEIKSPSQRLRAVLYVVWKEVNPTTTPRVDLIKPPRYAAPRYPVHDQEAAHVTSLSDGRRRFYHSHI